MRKFIISGITLLLMSGCSTTEVQAIGNNTYTISASSPFNGTGKKADIIRKANEFAATKGKVAESISLNESHPSVGFGGFFEYQFRLVDKEN